MNPIGLLTLGTLLQVGSAAAQDTTTAPVRSNDVVVIARDVPHTDRQIRDFVHALTPSGVTDDPIARFDTEKLCPLAIGLTPAYDKAMTDRLRRVAAAARIDLAAEGCRQANALVLFVDDKAAALAMLRKQCPWLFADRYGDLIRPRREAGPATAWHLKGLVSREGAPITQDGSGFYVSRTAATPSRLQAAARPVFVLAVVLIERRGVEGLTVVQVADYSAMRAFADARPTAATSTGAPTILTVLDAKTGSETPASLTAWDLNFLRGLYAAPPNSLPDAQRNAIGRYVKRQLDGQDGHAR